MLGLYLEKPELIDSITLDLFELHHDLYKNIPIILNDIKEYLVSKATELLDKSSGTFKSQVLELKEATARYKTGFISKNWTKLSKGLIQQPEVSEIDFHHIEKMFPLKRQNEILREMEEIEEVKKLKFNYVNDYWKNRNRITSEFVADLSKNPSESKYGSKNLTFNSIKLLEKHATQPPIPHLKINKDEE